MKISKIISLLKKHKPVSAFDLAGVLKLKELGQGSFRRVYRIVNSPFVIKFPHLGRSSGSDTAGRPRCIKHSALEADRHRHFMGFHELRYHLPRLYFHDRKTGVIVMEYVEEDKTDRKAYWMNDALYDLVAVLIKSLTRKKMTDISENNLKLSKDGQLKFIDLAF